MEKTKILFVCLGNICRSPLANEILQDLIDKENLQDQFEIDSCGTGAWHVGHLPDERMRLEASKHGITMTHRARQVSKNDFAYYDVILAMDKSNMNNLLLLCPTQFKNKIKLFRSFDPIANNGDAEVPDPYYGGAAGFSNVYQMIERTCLTILRAYT